MRADAAASSSVPRRTTISMTPRSSPSVAMFEMTIADYPFAEPGISAIF
jgi:hypothetical protein